MDHDDIIEALGADRTAAKVMAAHVQMVWDGIDPQIAEAGLATAMEPIARFATRELILEAYRGEIGPDKAVTQEALNNWLTARKLEALDEVVDRLTVFIKSHDELGVLTREHAKAFLSEKLGLL